MNRDQKISIILPAKNEAASLTNLLPRLLKAQPEAEIIVVNDGSTDETSDICKTNGIKCLHSPYSKGNGASIKQGARAAQGQILVFMDADGQHDPADIEKLLDRYHEGYDMVVGSRTWHGQAGVGRGFANAFYNWFSSYVTGHTISDLTSGFRIVNAKKFREFLHLLPNGFSYPTTSTIAFFRSAYSVSYININVSKRIGKSHLKPIRDGVRFLLIIFKVISLYSPLKLFAPASAFFFFMGTAYYGYTLFTQHRFTNMSALLFSAAVIIFLIGLISEQITNLTYRPHN